MANFPSLELNTINSLTLPLISRKIADNITGRIPLFYFLNKIGHKEYENGGIEYRFPVFYQLSNAQFYTGNTTLTNSEKDPVITAIYQRKYASQDITLSGTKLIQNSGSDPTAVVNYIAAQIEMAEESMKNTLAGSTSGILSAKADGDTDGITGLQTFLTDSTTTGTVGTLSRSTYSWWRHNSDSVTTGFGTDGLMSMRLLLLACSRGDESPTVGILTRTGYGLLLKAFTGTINYNTPSPTTRFGDIGFEHVNFFGTPILFDDGIPSSRGYFLNLKYMKLIVYKDRDMSIRDFISPTTEDSIVGRIYWAGNLICNNLSRQGIVQGLLDTDL